MSVSRWDPFQDLLAIQDEVNQLFGRATGGQSVQGRSQGQPGATTTTDQGTTTQAEGDVVDAEIIDEGDQDQQKGA